ncbi:MAG: hypothetical protein FOGNACKC_04145 [Anaerolineae bacterium]|nr:hypothetical protein [Anaerolineae bacterium]
MRRWPRHPATVLAVYTLLAVGLTWPLLWHLAEAVPSDIGDPLLNTWILAWDAHALLTDPLDLFNANIFYPLPNTLAYSEHLFSTALLALPLQLITTEPTAAYNLSLLLSFPLAAFGMYLLALHWTGRRDAAFIAGLVFGFAPYRFAAIAHLQLLTFQWLPFALLMVEKIVRSQESGVQNLSGKSAIGHSSLVIGHWSFAIRYSLLALFLALQLLASWYLAVYSALIVGVFILVRLPFLRYAPRATAVKLMATLLVVVALSLPLAAPYLRLLPQLRAARPLELALGLAAAPTDFAAAAPFNRLFGPLTESLRSRPNFTEENWLFVGFIAPTLALFALGFSLRRSSRPTPPPYSLLPTSYSLLLILLIALALTFPGPYAALATLLPPSTVVRVPPRWIIPALFALAGLAAFGFAAINRKLVTRHSSLVIRHWSFVIISVLLLSESLSAPIPLAEATPRARLNPAYHWLAAQPGPPALVELPVHAAPAPEYPEVKRLQASTLGWWGLVNGYSGYTPPRQPELAAALAGFPAAPAIAALQSLPTDRPLFVLVHPGEAPLNRNRWEQTDRWLAEANPALWPVGQFEGDELFKVQPTDPARFAGRPLAQFGPDGNIELLDAILTPNPPRLALYWRAAAPVTGELTVFVHLRAADGFVRSQADGPPVSGHLPAANWLPGQVVQDIHPLPAGEAIDLVDHVAVGLYQPASGERLPAAAPTGRPLPDNAAIIPLR